MIEPPAQIWWNHHLILHERLLHMHWHDVHISYVSILMEILTWTGGLGSGREIIGETNKVAVDAISGHHGVVLPVMTHGKVN